MGGNSLLIGALALMTLTIVVFYLIVERIGLAKAKDEHHHSAITDGAPHQKNG